MYGRRLYPLLLIRGTEETQLKQSGKIALGGVLGALSLVFMLLTIFPYMTYALPAIAGVMLIPVVMENGVRWGWMVFAAVAFVAALIVPSMEAKVMFIAFFGYYPVLKATLERLRSRVLEWVLKLLVFNVTMVAAYLLMLYVFGLPADEFEIGGVNLPLVFLGLGNVVFVIYDMALTSVITMYTKALHPKLMRIFRH